jgi:hypothetical protein
MTPLLSEINLQASRLATQLAEINEPISRYIASQSSAPLHNRLDMRLRNIISQLTNLQPRLTDIQIQENDLQQSPLVQLSLSVQELQKSVDRLKNPDFLESPLLDIQRHCKDLIDEITLSGSSSSSQLENSLINQLNTLKAHITQMENGEVPSDAPNIQIVVDLTQRITSLFSNPDCPFFDPHLIAVGMMSDMQELRTRLTSSDPVSSLADRLHSIAERAQLVLGRINRVDPGLAADEQQEIDGFVESGVAEFEEAERLLKRDYSVELAFQEKQVQRLANECPQFYHKVQEGNVEALLDLYGYLTFGFLREFPEQFESIFIKNGHKIGSWEAISLRPKEEADASYRAFLELKHALDEDMIDLGGELAEFDKGMKKIAQSEMQFISRLTNTIMKRRAPEIEGFRNFHEGSRIWVESGMGDLDTVLHRALTEDYPEVATIFTAPEILPLLSDGQVTRLFSYFADRNRIDSVRVLLNAKRPLLDTAIGYASNPDNPQQLSILKMLASNPIVDLLSDDQIGRTFKLAADFDQAETLHALLDSSSEDIQDYFQKLGHNWLTDDSIFNHPERFKALYNSCNLTQKQYEEIFFDVLNLVGNSDLTEFLASQPHFQAIQSDGWIMGFQQMLDSKSYDRLDFMCTRFKEEQISKEYVKLLLLGSFSEGIMKKFLPLFLNQNVRNLLTKPDRSNLFLQLVSASDGKREDAHNFLHTWIASPAFRVEFSTFAVKDIEEATLHCLNSNYLNLFTQLTSLPNFGSRMKTQFLQDMVIQANMKEWTVADSILTELHTRLTEVPPVTGKRKDGRDDPEEPDPKRQNDNI